MKLRIRRPEETPPAPPQSIVPSRVVVYGHDDEVLFDGPLLNSPPIYEGDSLTLTVPLIWPYERNRS